jgi:hypothetical protein
MSGSLSSIENTIRTLTITGAILEAGLLISGPTVPLLRAATACVALGILFFVLAAQFLISIRMDTQQREEDAQAKDGRLVLPFLLGIVAYSVSGVLVCVQMFFY